MKLIRSLSQAQIQQLHKLYQNEWWTNDRSLQDTQQIVEGSQLVLGLVNQQDELLAFCRVLTDYTIKALIFDLIVAPAFRQQGYAARLIEELKQADELQRIRHFELYCLPELYGFYKQYGFTDELDGIGLMRCSA